MRVSRRTSLNRWLLAVASVLVIAATTGCSSSDSAGEAAGDPTTDKLAQIVARGTLVGYHERDYPPQSIDVEGATRPAETKCAETQLTANQVDGYDSAVTKLVAQGLGVEACFATPTWTEVNSGNWGDRWDIAYASGSINADRMKRLYMTQPYYAVPNFYFVAADATSKHAADLNGKRIGACAGCSHEAYLNGELAIPGIEVAPTVENPHVVTFETEGPGLGATEKGAIDAFLAADPVGNARIKEGSKLRKLPDLAFTYYPSGLVDKSSGLSAAAFVTSVDEIVMGLHANGTLKKLSLKWFGQDYASAAADYDIASIEQETR